MEKPWHWNYAQIANIVIEIWLLHPQTHAFALSNVLSAVTASKRSYQTSVPTAEEDLCRVQSGPLLNGGREFPWIENHLRLSAVTCRMTKRTWLHLFTASVA